MRVEARRWILRHESRSYGTQQLRNLYNVLAHDKGIRSAASMMQLLPSSNRLANKGWVRQVPAAAGIPAPQVVPGISWPKASVAGLVSP
jgi:hypothetical protein